MYQPSITGTGVFTPEHIITNDELAVAFNAYADRVNAKNAEAIAENRFPNPSQLGLPCIAHLP